MSSNYLIVIRMSLFFIACSVASNNFADIDKSRLDAVEAEIQTLIDGLKMEKRGITILYFALLMEFVVFCRCG